MNKRLKALAATTFGVKVIYKQFKKTQKAFTLAETLIVLSVLGLIAAITIPNLIHNYKMNILKTKLKQTYSDIEHVSRTFWLTHDGQSMIKYKNGTKEAINDIIDNKYITIQSTKEQNNNQYIVNTINPEGIYKDLTGTTGAFMSYGAGYFKDGKGRDWYSRATNPVYIDINGYENGPNRLGIDFFAFWVDDNGEVDLNKRHAQFVCNTTKNNRYNGSDCTKYAILNKHPSNDNKNYWVNFLNSVK